MTIERSELLVVVNWEDRIVRVFENTPEAEAALKAWEKHDTAYVNGTITDDDYREISEWMEERNVKCYTTQTEDLL